MSGKSEDFLSGLFIVILFNKTNIAWAGASDNIYKSLGEFL